MKLKKILLPVDFSDRCPGAARFAESLARHFDAQITVVNVLPPPHYELSGLEVGGSMLTEILSNRKAQLQQELETFARVQFPGKTVRNLILEGDPAGKIVEFAHREEMDLIVMPTHGYGPFRRFIFGSVTAKVLHDADVPVLTGAHLEDIAAIGEVNFRSVVCALDLGPHSEAVVGYASEMAAEYGSKLAVVHATPTLESSSGEYFSPEWRGMILTQAREEMTALLQRTGVKADICIGSGDPAAVVRMAAENHHADLVIIGRGIHTGILGRLRANAYSILRESPCAVLSV